jgi:hypothetical protein
MAPRTRSPVTLVSLLMAEIIRVLARTGLPWRPQPSHRRDGSRRRDERPRVEGVGCRSKAVAGCTGRVGTIARVTAPAQATTRDRLPPDLERRHFALLRAFTALELPRSVLAAIAGVGYVAFVALVVDRARLSPPGEAVAFVVAVAGFVAVTYGLATLFRPRSVARAFEVYRWVGRRDWLDWRRRAGRRVPQTRRQARAWLDMEQRRPDAAARDQLPRIEIYVWLGELDDALRGARSLPTERPWDRFARDLMVAFVAFVAGDRSEAEGALSAARASAEQLSGDERRLAAAKIAVEEARRLAFDAGAGISSRRGEFARADAPWLQPLDAVRDRLGPYLDGFLVRDLARWALPVLIALGIACAAVSFWVAGVA